MEAELQLNNTYSENYFLLAENVLQINIHD